MKRAYAQCAQAIGACCCYSKEALRVTRMPTAQFTSRLSTVPNIRMIWGVVALQYFFELCFIGYFLHKVYGLSH